ncbi:MAG: tetratricopeptide repeat protein [Neisseria sp.]|uniref:tetratricopeptide repeat protein n=1 Tax=Neisseria sp. TaxID=192066 RepID=UPI0026DCC4D8|nr:tetratricopeptide repeat protein [Neisseria sp.]MDO4641700.1 tetratricopeptide repeat protein [Neisseria sp.]
MSTRNQSEIEKYAQKQFDIGLKYYKASNLNEAIKAWLKVPKNVPETYAKAQFNLGVTYQKQGKLDEVINAWLNVKETEKEPELYAQAQINLGVAYDEQGKLDKAINAYLNVPKNVPELYAQAQFNLGLTYEEQGNLEEAINAWLNVPKNVPEPYAFAQYNLGVIYSEKNEPEKTIKAYQSVPEDVPGLYAMAKFNQGSFYQTQSKLDEAIKAWESVSSRVIDQYSKAQFNLGLAYEEKGKLDEAINAWLNVKETEKKSELYAKAQFNLAAVYEKQKRLDDAIEALLNVKKTENEFNDLVELNLGKLYLKNNEESKAEEAFKRSSDSFYHPSECGIKIINCSHSTVVRTNLIKLMGNTEEILEKLSLIHTFESQVAHYTRRQTAFKLLESGKDSNGLNKDKASAFRLSTMRGVNDPAEGKVLSRYLEQQHLPSNLYMGSEFATFVSCFTFNHDSLNQFRLYGKENNQEASGISLIFNVQDFFEDKLAGIASFINPNKVDSLTKEASNGSKEKPSDNLPKSGIEEQSKKVGDKGTDEKPKVDKLAIYRCIYLDPDSGYFALAARDELTFYRECVGSEEQTTEEIKGNASKKWEEYQEEIKQKTTKIQKLLYLGEEGNYNTSSVLYFLREIFKVFNSEEVVKKDRPHIIETIRFILLPLQYLIKHAAFQEEQECRMLYITQWNDKKIHSYRESNEMYVEYNEPVRRNLKKIYLSPGAVEHEDFFRVLLKGTETANKICISSNPFRHKG